MRLAADAGAVGRALVAARAFAGACGLDAAATDQLAIVVEEWVVNIVEHGRPSAASLVVIRLALLDGGAVRIAFSDAGIAFDPRTVGDDGPNLERGGGAGIALIRSWCDFEAYERRGGRNRLVLRSRS